MSGRVVRQIRASMLAFALVAVMQSVAVLAHHSFADYDDKKRLTVSGVLVELRWQNPHIGLTLRVPDDKGGETVMDFSGPSITDWRAAGWVKSDFVVGEKLTITGFPKRDDPHHMSINVLVNAKGKSFGHLVE